MGKNKPARRVSLADFKTARRSLESIEIEGEDGKVFVIDPPVLWPDEVAKAAATGDGVAMATAILGGEDRYAEFVAAGGSAKLLSAIIGDHLGISVPESSASSSS